MDYILCYKSKKRRASKHRLSISSNGGVPLQTLGRWEAGGESVEPGGPAADVEDSKLTEEEKALMREDFEAGLVEAGLQIERDKEVRVDVLRWFYSGFFLRSKTLIDVYGSEHKSRDWPAGRQVEDKT